MQRAWAVATMLSTLVERARCAERPLYFSRPDIAHPPLTVFTNKGGSGGELLLVAPTAASGDDVQLDMESGPLIFDSNGHLVWSGAARCGAGGAGSLVGIEPCVFEAAPALCFFRGQKRGAAGFGHGAVLNQRYDEVRVVAGAGAHAAVDLHEFRALEGGTALFTTYRPRPHDLGLDGGVGWVLDAGFREVNLSDGAVVFAWDALDRVGVGPAAAALLRYPAAFGSGHSPRDALDFFHINAVDKDAAGDYLVSARHADALFKIARADGSVLWRLGGAGSSFVAAADVAFRRQHHARHRFQNATHTVVTLFNNDADGYAVSARESAGLEILLDHGAMTATLRRRLVAPGGLVGLGMGSFQTRSNGNAVLCHGSNATITEFSPSGDVVFHAAFPPDFFLYRALVHPWVGEPREPPAVWAFARTATSSVHIYASWNGATEVAAWNFYAASASGGPFVLLGSSAKRSFETSFTCNHCVAAVVIAEAIGRDATALRNSTEVTLFVPPRHLRARCGPAHCFAPLPPNYCAPTAHTSLVRDAHLLRSHPASSALVAKTVAATLATVFLVLFCARKLAVLEAAWNRVLSIVSQTR